MILFVLLESFLDVVPEVDKRANNTLRSDAELKNAASTRLFQIESNAYIPAQAIQLLNELKNRIIAFNQVAIWD